MHTILIVDDDAFIREILKGKLESEGYRALEAAGKPALLAQLQKNDIHLILLDVMLDKDNGIELISEIKSFTDIPIIMVSSKDHLFDKIIALEMGADDYICKPAEPRELLSRIKAHIRRYTGGKNAPEKTMSGSLCFGGWKIDFSSFSVKDKNGDDAGLTKDEFDLLATLAGAPNVVFTRETLFEKLRADNFDAFDRAIDIQIMRVRKKLGDNARAPKFIRTIRKVGYQFVAPVEKN